MSKKRTVKDRNGEEHEIDEDNFLVSGVLIKVDLCDIINNDVEGFLDLISEDAGFPLLMQQDYTIEGHEPENVLLLRVKGDVSMELENQED